MGLFSGELTNQPQIGITLNWNDFNRKSIGNLLKKRFFILEHSAVKKTAVQRSPRDRFMIESFDLKS